MDIAKLDELMDRLERERSSGGEPSVEKVCTEHPELIEPLRKKWEAARRYGEHLGTRPESTFEVQQKLSAMPENMMGHRLVMQSDIKIEEFHDHGGLGEVYRATDTELSRDVAVKLLRSDRNRPANIEDFRRESQILGGLVHPGIVSIYGSGETIEGRPFYCMPFVDRGNLRASLAEFHRENRSRVVESNKDFRDLIYRLVSVCKTIAYAHSRGIIHRDLKTENVLLGKYGETLVIDWGCATRVERGDQFKVYGERTLQLNGVDESNSSGGLTLRYASPEQLHGNAPVGPESDIYSLGAMLYILLTGESPLEREIDLEVRKRVLGGEVPAPESLKAGVPLRLAAVCKKAMAKDPSDRYPTALGMAEDLERYLSDETVSVCRDSWGLRMARVVRRNRTASLLLFVTLLIASGILTLAFAGQSVFARRADASAKERLRMAATLAGNLGGFEINRRITILEKEAASQELTEAMLAINDDLGNQQLWGKAQNLIYEFRDELLASGIALENMALMDREGTQIARAPKSDSIGRNFAYRNYFHGLREDLDPESEDYKNNPPEAAKQPIVSNAYVSTNKDETGQYPIKTSFTVAIMAPAEVGKPRKVLGRLGMSIKINDLAVFDRLSELSVDAVLIETRDYAWGTGTANGLILDRIRSSGPEIAVPTDLNTEASRQAVDEIQDSMARLSDKSIEDVSSQLMQSKEAILISDFRDGQVSEFKKDAACARLNIPYRSDIVTGWTVIFIESPRPNM